MVGHERRIQRERFARQGVDICARLCWQPRARLLTRGPLLDTSMCMDENELRAKRARALELRRSGSNVRDIARLLKVEYLTACQLLLDAMKESKKARAVAA